MDLYQIADGHDNEVAFITLNPQPLCTGIKPGQLSMAGDLSMVEDGHQTTEWVYNILEAEWYDQILIDTGLTSAQSNAVTIRTKIDADRSFANYNATIYRPTPNFRHGGMWTDVIFKIVIEGTT